MFIHPTPSNPGQCLVEIAGVDGPPEKNSAPTIFLPKNNIWLSCWLEVHEKGTTVSLSFTLSIFNTVVVLFRLSSC
ncbi:unnamed protein product [Victoria cruziana]